MNNPFTIRHKHTLTFGANTPKEDFEFYARKLYFIDVSPLSYIRQSSFLFVTQFLAIDLFLRNIFSRSGEQPRNSPS